MKRFLKMHDLKEKRIIPFNTNAGYGVGSGFQTVRQLCPQSKVTEGYETKGGIERDGVKLAIKDERIQQEETKVRQWLVKIGLKVAN